MTVSSCGSLANKNTPGSTGVIAVDVNGNVCGISGGTGGTSSFGPNGAVNFTGADGTTQFAVGSTLLGAEFFTAYAGITGAGATLLCTNAVPPAAGAGNVTCNMTALGSGNIFWGNNGNGILGKLLDPGGAVAAPIIQKPGTGTTPGDINCGSTPCTLNSANVFSAAGALNCNGDFNFDQVNEGAATTPAASSSRVTDCWRTSQTANSHFTFTQSTTAPTGYAHSMLVAVASTSTPGTTNRIEFMSRLAGQEIAPLLWGTAGALPVTLDFQVQGNASFTYPVNLPVALDNNAVGGTYRTYVHDVVITSASTWTNVSIPIAGDTNASSWGTTFGAVALTINFELDCGSNFQTPTPDAWTTGQYYCTSGSTQVVTVTGATLNICCVHLRVGKTDYPYVALPYNVEFGRVQRSYYKTQSPGTAVVATPATAINKGEIQFPATIAGTGVELSPRVLFPQQMKASPTITFYSPATNSSATCRDETAGADAGTASAVNVTANGTNITCAGAAGTTVGGIIGVHLTADSGM